MGVFRKKASGMAPAMSPAWAWMLFLQTSGKWPASLRMPPFAPPMPRAQVLHAFRECMRRQRRQKPTSRPFRKT